MFDHDEDRRRNAGLTALNPLAEEMEFPASRETWEKHGYPVKEMFDEPRALRSFEMLDRLEAYLRHPRVKIITHSDPLSASGDLKHEPAYDSRGNPFEAYVAWFRKGASGDTDPNV